jgi:hypothetical protein
VDQSARYIELCRQGRDVFLKTAAEAAVVRRCANVTEREVDANVEGVDTTMLASLEQFTKPRAGGDVEVHPLIKKPGAPFSDMITVGRTANNDLVLNDVTVSRFHAYFRAADGAWRVCDAGSKNGTKLAGKALEARKEVAIHAGQAVTFGDIQVTFYPAAELYELLAAKRR